MHIHILPGVDDGSQNMEMSMEMIRIAAENNIGTMILTPHNNAAHHCVSPESQERRLQEFQEKITEGGYHIRLYPGNECMYDYTLPERLNDRKAMTLADSDYCLVEFNPMEEFPYIQEALRSLLYEGYHPVLAHVERYLCLTKKRELVDDLVRNGVYLQVNANDTIPHMFNKMAKFVNGLLADGLVSFVSTDAHRPVGRAPLMKEAAAHLNRHYDPDYVKAILHDNAMKVIANEEI